MKRLQGISKKILNILLGLFSFDALANLEVQPTRLLLNERKQTGSLSLRHTGSASEKYRVQIIFYKFNSKGEPEKAVSPNLEPDSALPYLRFAPREIILEPQKEQVIRVTTTAGYAQLAEGELRAHVYLESAGLSGDPRVAVAVPTILRKGSPSFQLTLKDFNIFKKGSENFFRIEMERTGSAFAFGNLEVFLQAPGGGSKKVAHVEGVSCYLKVCEVAYPLNLLDNAKLNEGRLRLEFRLPKSEGHTLLAYRFFNLKD